jgi:hypothetical protein
MVIITYIYSDNERTKQTIDSFSRFGYEVAVLRRDSHRGNGEVLRELYEVYRRASTGHDCFVYADAADSYCQRPFTEEEVDYFRHGILYSTEKACYPHPEIAQQYPKDILDDKSPWKFLNGGGYGGSPKLMVEFMEKFGLLKHKGDANGQHEQMMAYLEADKAGFPIALDVDCTFFQTMAFADPSEFDTRLLQPDVVIGGQKKVVHNKITSTIPAILHFNGCTPMTILNELK